jgi:hypothetical protein
LKNEAKDKQSIKQKVALRFRLLLVDHHKPPPLCFL